MKIGLLIATGMILGYVVKQMVNWLKIDSYVMNNKNFFLEVVGASLITWSALNLDAPEAVIFSIVAMSLAGISIIDFHTFQIPLIFIIIGVAASFAGILFKVIFLSSALWGIFVGAFIPLAIMLILWFITKRQGMGYGDIQMGLVLGAWLGPMRMAYATARAAVQRVARHLDLLLS